MKFKTLFYYPECAYLLLFHSKVTREKMTIWKIISRFLLPGFCWADKEAEIRDLHLQHGPPSFQSFRTPASYCVYDLEVDLSSYKTTDIVNTQSKPRSHHVTKKTYLNLAGHTKTSKTNLCPYWRAFVNCSLHSYVAISLNLYAHTRTSISYNFVSNSVMVEAVI